MLTSHIHRHLLVVTFVEADYGGTQQLDLTLQYKDEDGDVITVRSQEDLQVLLFIWHSNFNCSTSLHINPLNVQIMFQHHMHVGSNYLKVLLTRCPLSPVSYMLF